jgi:hypothetical protein
MVGSVEIRGVSDGAAKFNRFEGIGVVKGNELGNKVRPFRLEPKMEKKVAGVESATRVHKTAEIDERGIDTQLKSNMR